MLSVGTCSLAYCLTLALSAMDAIDLLEPRMKHSGNLDEAFIGRMKKY